MSFRMFRLWIFLWLPIFINYLCLHFSKIMVNVRYKVVSRFHRCISVISKQFVDFGYLSIVLIFLIVSLTRSSRQISAVQSCRSIITAQTVLTFNFRRDGCIVLQRTLSALKWLPLDNYGTNLTIHSECSPPIILYLMLYRSL